MDDLCVELIQNQTGYVEKELNNMDFSPFLLWTLLYRYISVSWLEFNSVQDYISELGKAHNISLFLYYIHSTPSRIIKKLSECYL